MVRRYRPQSYSGAIKIIACEKLYRGDSTLGWSELSGNNLSTYPVPGDHDAYLREHVQVTARRLRKCLEEAENRGADETAFNQTAQDRELSARIGQPGNA